MTGAAATLAHVLGALDAAGAQHMIVGSFASTLHGEPRTTQDIDIVVRLDAEQLERFLAAFAETEWYVDHETARNALARHSMFNLVDFATGWKVDVIAEKPDTYSRAAFDRRIETEFLGTPACVATAEDTILSKLLWARLGSSDRQIRDVVGVLAVAGDALDRDYLDRWATQLALGDLLERAERSARERDD